MAGKFKKDVYTAPDKSFKAKFLLEKHDYAGANSWGVADSWDEVTGIGTLSFYNINGELHGVIYTRIPPNKADSLTPEALSEWLHAVPLSMTEDAGLTPKILAEEAGEFAGLPAWIAVVRIPGGGVVEVTNWGTGEAKQSDSARGFIVFARGRYVYGLHCEIEHENFPWGSKSHYDPENWDAFIPELQRFYSAMKFRGE